MNFSDSMMFRLVNENGETIGSDSSEWGLLLYHGDTVCDDEFDDNSADAICNEMGYTHGARNWTSGNLYESQSGYEIGLDEVVCSSDSWESCTFASDHDCSHSEDVHLHCALDGKLSDFIIMFKWSHIY